jgi:hypothetical protein
MSLLKVLGLRLVTKVAEPATTNGQVHDMAAIDEAQEVWHRTRSSLDASIALLKQAIRTTCANEGPALVAIVDKTLVKFDVILERLDTGLADSLQRARSADSEAVAKAELQASKSQLMAYMNYVKSEPLIAQLDSNPFGVDTRVKQTLSDSFSRIARTIGRTG